MVFWYASSVSAGIRCGTQLVNEGDSSMYVESICGAPEVKQQRSIFVTHGIEANSEQLHRRSMSHRSIRSIHGYVETTEEIVIDEWLYNFGPNRLVQEVVFKDDRVISIKSKGYGY